VTGSDWKRPDSDLTQHIRDWENQARQGIRAYLTKEKAKQVREWRKKGSWRWVASKAYYVWDEPDCVEEGHQLYGMWLCEEAAALLGEDPRQGPWN
jgi:hypothetical protein